MKNRHSASLAAAIIIAVAILTSTVTATEYAFITTTDYSSGSASVIWLDRGIYNRDGRRPRTQ